MYFVRKDILYILCLILFTAKMYCPEGWGSPFAEYCYLPISEEKSWGEAQSFCKDNQSTSDLASVFSVYEDIKIRTLAKDLGNKDPKFIYTYLAHIFPNIWYIIII